METTKILNLELSDDEQAIVTAQRKLARAKERVDESQRDLHRRTGDVELFGKTFDPDERQRLEFRIADDEALVDRLAAELAAAQRAPEERRQKEARGEELLAQARSLDAEIERWAETGATLHERATTLADTIEREFRDPTAAPLLFLTAPFKRSPVLQRLRFWARTVGTRGDVTTFAQRLKQYREINNPPPPVEIAIHRPVVDEKARAKQRREAMQNARLRSRQAESGAIVVDAA